MERSHSKR